MRWNYCPHCGHRLRKEAVESEREISHSEMILGFLHYTAPISKSDLMLNFMNRLTKQSLDNALAALLEAGTVYYELDKVSGTLMIKLRKEG